MGIIITPTPSPSVHRMLGSKSTRSLAFFTKKVISQALHYTHFVAARGETSSSQGAAYLGLRPLFINEAPHYHVFLGGATDCRERLYLPQGGKALLGNKIFEDWKRTGLPPALLLKLKKESLEIIPKKLGSAQPFEVMHFLSYIGNGHHIISPRDHFGFYGVSHPGINHEKGFSNEDRILAFECPIGNRYFLVADGLGGCPYGEKASRYAADLIQSRIQGGAGVDLAIREANQHLVQLIPQSGSTLAMVQVSPQKLVTCFSAGDSRIHILDAEGNDLYKNRLDVQFYKNEKGQTLSHLDNQLGITRDVYIHKAGLFDLSRGGWIFIYSDGVENNVPGGLFARIVKESLSPREASDLVIRSALSNMEHLSIHLPNSNPDNASVIAVKF